MPDHLAELYADHTGVAVLGVMATLALVGVYLVLQRIFVSVQLRRSRMAAERSEAGSEAKEDYWDWEQPADRTAVLAGGAEPDARPRDSRPGERIEYFEPISESSESSAVAETNAVASAIDIARSRRFAVSAGEIAGHLHSLAAVEPGALRDTVIGGLRRALTALAERGKRICGAAWDELHRTAGPRSVARPGDAMQRHLKATARARARSPDSHPAIAMGSPPRIRGPFGLVPRLSITSAFLAAAFFYAPNGGQRIDADPASSEAQGQARAGGSVDDSVDHMATASLGVHRRPPGNERASADGPDPLAARAKAGADGAQAAAAQEEASRARRAAADGERARSAALQGMIVESRGQVTDMRTRMENADAAGVLLREFIDHVVARMPAAYREHQRADGLERDLSRANARAQQIETAASEDRNRVAQLSGMLGDERRKSERLQGDLARAESAQAALAARANATEEARDNADAARLRAEQAAKDTEQALVRERSAAAVIKAERDEARRERDAAVALADAAKERAEQAAKDTERALLRERSATADTKAELDKARRERDAAIALADAAKERAEQATQEADRALAHERSAEAATRAELDKARRERDASRARSARLAKALDEQREATVAFARDLAAARNQNDRLRAERNAENVPLPKPRPGRVEARSGEVKAVSQKIARSELRDPPRVTRARAIALPYSLWPKRTAP